MIGCPRSHLFWDMESQKNDHEELTPVKLVSCPTRSKPPVFLLDTMSFIFRAYHAMQRSRPMSTRAGLPTAAIYVFVNMIKKLRQDFQPRYFAAVFDVSGEVFRDERARAMGPLRKWNAQDAELRRGQLRGLQGQSRRHARGSAPPDSLHPPRPRSPAHSHPPGRGLRGRRRHRHPGPRGRRAAA